MMERNAGLFVEREFAVFARRASSILIPGITRNPMGCLIESGMMINEWLNWPQPWPVHLGYDLLGRIVWPFIK